MLKKYSIGKNIEIVFFCGCLSSNPFINNKIIDLLGILALSQT